MRGMSAELISLAEKAVLLRGWQWQRGMGVVAIGPGSPEPTPFRLHQLDFLSRPVLEGTWSRILPDLTDPFTGGCLFRQLGKGWQVSTGIGSRGLFVSSADCLGESGSTLGEACARSAIAVGKWEPVVLHTPIANDPLYW